MNRLIDALTRANLAWANVLASAAGYSAINPYKTIAVYLFMCLSLASGFLNIDPASSAFEIWVDQDSQPKKNNDFFDDVYGSSESGVNIIAGVEDQPGNNILTKPVFDELFRLHDTLKEAMTSVGGRTYSDLCTKAVDGSCDTVGVLRHWNFNSSFYFESVINDTDIQRICARHEFPGKFS